jgi:peptidoglycan/LPS O-acetylase OafA/YrhL
MAKPHARVVELDILRAVAIIIIIFAHFNFFLPNVQFSNFAVGTVIHTTIISFGVALFLFISGFVLYLNHPSFPQGNGLADFFKKRVLRIFPLYWLAIATQVATGTQFASRIDALVVVLGLQGFLSPRFVTNIFLYWWFIGVILVLYTIYPLIISLASDGFRLPAWMQSDALKFALMLIVPFLILGAARSALFIITDSVFIFYGIFVLGIAVSKFHLLDKYGFLTDDRTRLLRYVAVFAVSITALLFIDNVPWLSANVSAVSRFASFGFSFIEMNVLFLLFSLLAFSLARIIVVSSSQTSRRPSHAVWYRALLLISFSSYAVYLFFLPILMHFMYALIDAQLTALEIDIIQISIGLPIVVVIAFVLQNTQNEILNRVRKFRTASEPYNSP